MAADPLTTVVPRPLVPTPRQVAGGEAAPGYEPMPIGIEPRGRRSVRRAVAGLLDRVDVRRIAGPRTPIVVFLAIALFGRLDELIFLVIGPELVADFATGPALLGFVLAASQIVSYLVLPLYGYLVDRVRRVWLLRIAHVGGNLVSTTAAFAAGPLGFAGARGAAGLLGVSGELPQATYLADRYKGESFGRLVTTIAAAQNVAIIAGPALAGVLVSATNWRVTLFVLGSIATLVGLATFFLREPRRGGSERGELGLSDVEPAPEPLPFAESWRVAASVQTLRRIWYATPFLVTSTAAYFVFLPLYLAQEFALSPAQRGLITTAAGATGIAALVWLTPVAGRSLARNPGRIMTMIAGLMAFEAIAFAVLGASGAVALSIVAALPLALGATVVPPLQQMVTLKILPPRVRGLGASTVAPWTILGFLLIAITIGAGTREAMFAMIPIQLVGAVLFASAAGTVDRDIRAARASVVAERAAREAKEAGRTALLVCRGVEAAYGGTQVLYGVDLDVADGEVLALLGTNGAGKSTLLRAIAGVHHASNGAILLDGRDITHEPAHANAARGVVMMPGGTAIFPSMTVEENLRAAVWLYRDDEASVREGMEQVLAFFPVLRERLGQTAGSLSGGEQQMVGLAQAFLSRPRLLMIDELSLGLAPSVVEQLLTILGAIHARGTTIVLVEQSVNVALGIAKRSVFMEKGEIRFDGPTEELLRKPELVRSVFIGGAAKARTLGVARRTRRRPGAPAGETGALAVEGVAVRFGGLQALSDVTLGVTPGEIVGVIGPNGAGKTTLFDVISGFVAPDGGRVSFAGRDVTGLPPDARARLGIGRSFQNVRLFPALTVRENIAVALERRTVRSEVMAALWLPAVRTSEAKVFRRVEGLIEILGLEAFADRFAHELSTGSRRAVEVACVMAAEPQVLLLDEPSSGLAQAESEELGPVLLRLVRETGCGLLVIEHDIPLITAIAGRLVAMDLGSVIATGASQEVLEDRRVLASYLGRDGDGNDGRKAGS